VKSFIRNLSPRGEFFLVIAIAFGPMLFASFRDAIIHSIYGFKPIHWTDAKQLELLTYELIAITLISWIARIRGWSFTGFGLRISWKLTGTAILLFIATILLLLIQTILYRLFIDSTFVRAAIGRVSLPFVILVSLINPFYEEILEVGYFTQTFKRYGMWPTVLLSAFFRCLLHVYGGFHMATDILFVGLIWALFYWRYRQLWPLILIHMVWDFNGLLHLTNPG